MFYRLPVTDDDSRWTKQSAMEVISLHMHLDDVAFRLIRRLLGNRFSDVRVKWLAYDRDFFDALAL